MIEKEKKITNMKLYELYFLTENKWKDKVPTLSDKSINRLKKAGLVKPEKDYIKGIEKGTKNIVKKYRIKFTDDIIKDNTGLTPSDIEELKRNEPELYNKFVKNIGGEDRLKLMDSKGKIDIGPAYDPDGKRINIPKKMSRNFTKYAFGSKKDYEKIKPLLKRHEADEVRTFKKLNKKYKGMNPNLNVAGGSHFGPEVLKKEKKLVDFYDKVYSKLDHWKTIRIPEYEEIKKYGNARALRKTRERVIRQSIRDVLKINPESYVEFGLTKKQYLKSITPGIKKSLSVLPKSKVNLNLANKVLKFLGKI